MSLKNLVDLLTKNVTKNSTAPTRHLKWEETRRSFILQHPHCEVCGGESLGELNVHHIVPYDVALQCGRPDLECDFRNLITLCEGDQNHHHVVGHLGDWHSYNLHVRRDAKRDDCRGQPSERIMRRRWWLERYQDRPHNVLDPDQTTAMRTVLDNLYPREAVARPERARIVATFPTPALDEILSQPDRQSRTLLGALLDRLVNLRQPTLLIIVGSALLAATVMQADRLDRRALLGLSLSSGLLLALGLHTRLRGKRNRRGTARE
ncbi:MAG: HNH endonuclease [Polyangia bacterium]|jgi:hypothetical protein